MADRQYAVIGLGEFGRAVARTLIELGADVLVMDKDPQVIHEVESEVTRAIQLDVTDEVSLRETGVGDADVAIVGVGEDLEAAIVVTVLLKRLGVKQVVVKAKSGLPSYILKLVGADMTVDPEEEMGKRLGLEVYAPDVHARIRLSTGQEVLEIEAPKVFWGKTLAQLNFRSRYRLNIIAVKRKIQKTSADGTVIQEWEVNKLPNANDTINEGDVLIAVGDERDVKHFLNLL